MQEIFRQIYLGNMWGDKESVSGPGSRVDSTKLVAQTLPGLIAQFQIRSILDAACGDFNWMRHVDLNPATYTGIDIVPELIEHNLKTYANQQRQFRLLNLTSDPLPLADLILCRDCLVHLPYAGIWAAIDNFKKSGAKYLLTTTFTDHQTNRDINTGDWRFLNLELEPFNFPKPLYLIQEQPPWDKSLALWELKSLPGAAGRFRILSGLSDEIRAISRVVDLLTPDILVVYPARLTPAKRLEKVVAFAAAIQNRTRKSVKIVFCDFPSADINPDLYKALLRRLARALQLTDGAIAFTSELGYEQGFPRKGVLDLFTLSNLFVCPSFSESFGLTALEAASRGNFLVLNEKVPALAEMGSRLHAYFMRWDARNFGFDSKEGYLPTESEYLEEHAGKVVEQMMSNPLIWAKTVARQGC